MERSPRREEMEAAASYIESIPRFTKKNTPEVTRAYLALLGAGRLSSRIIHVAGTNGKGSVCAYLDRILRAAGAGTGLFISPHLSDIRERIRLDGDLIPEEDFLASYERVLSLCGKDGLPHPAYFEFLFLMAMDYFRRQAPEYLVLETGLGGRLDATNTAEGKVLTILTRIGIDHTLYLGDTLSSIAGEKAGILRKGVPALTLTDPPEALAVFRERAGETGAPLYEIGPDLWQGSRPCPGGIDFSLNCGYHTEGGDGPVRAVLATRALYQCENAALAASGALLLGKEDERIGRAAIEEGLARAFWPGRMEEARPGVFLDGAHNSDGIRAFLDTVREIRPEEGGRRILLFSVVGDKDYGRMAGLLLSSGLFDVFAAAPMAGSRALSGQVLQRTLEEARDRAGADVLLLYSDSPRTALREVLSMKGEKDLVFAAGSLYLIGELRDLLEKA